MAKEKKVIDASVMVKWFNDEEKTSKALEILNSHIKGEITLIAPELVFLETLNALRYKKTKEIMINPVINSLKNIQIHIEHLTPFLLEQTFKIALKYDLTIYDAIYCTIAQIHGIGLLTADQELGKLPFVEML